MRTLAIFLTSLTALPTLSASTQAQEMEETTVIADRLARETALVSPTSIISAEELKAINLLTAEDSVTYEPSVVIRRRYVGDPNGVLGIRGSGMFQTARSMVFADGLPLHYLLQTRWSGSPRWSLVGPDEIESAQVIYGPYSAQYSGNSMGGVVDIKTRTPSERKISLHGTLMSQDYDVLGTNDSFGGNKVFASYEDKFEGFTLFTSFNRLKNESQPLTNYSLDAADADELEAQGITGFIRGQDERGEPVIYVGDSGKEVSVTELYKATLGYDFANVQLRGTIAYEDRSRDEEDKNNYLRDAQGNVFWGAGNRNFEERHHDRESLLLGFGISGYLPADWYYDVYATDFDIRKDEEIRTGLSSADPVFGTRAGRFTEYDDTGWNTLDIKFGTENLFGDENQRMSVGYYLDSYELQINARNIDAATGARISDRASSGGETSTQALFVQWGWSLNQQWDVSMGLRYEDWKAENGFNGDTQASDRSESGTSPKLSLAYTPNDDWSFRYSVARALRFPITEELYRNESSTTNIVIADTSLDPEEGIHHSFSIDHPIDDGVLRFNLFYETVENSIYNQTGTIRDGNANVSVTTFLAVDEVETKGAEFIYNQQALFGTKLLMRFNTSYTDATISENRPNPEIEGNEMPRIPEWRANLILNYPVSETVDLSTSFRYASDTFGDLDNGDSEGEVYGAIDDYFFVNLKSNWAVNENINLSLGVDNVFDELAYVAHPWPSRTYFLEARMNY
ncbi:MAG: TonB-dependent receptor [Halioglobus sp.]